jgi:hypothetical protein
MTLWGDSSANPFGGKRKGAAHLAAVERLKDLTRERFALGEDDTVLVTETQCALPGFPPLDTVVAFWSADGTRHHYRVFRPAQEVVESDIPPAWMKDALAAAPGIECSCC